jgi:Vacuolar protein sorting-associated protein 62
VWLAAQVNAGPAARTRWRVGATRLAKSAAVAILAGAALCGPSVNANASSGTSRSAADDPATTLAERYAPVLRLVDHPERCGVDGEAYQPTNVDAVLDNPLVSLRGPWGNDNLVKVAPTAQDLSVGLPGYNLDFPGEALNPGCTYADWAKQVDATTPATMYAHVVTQPGYPDHLALQYWFFYLYNDFNDKHEGDWEGIQLNFKAATVQQALTMTPYEVGYSQHEGAERAVWGDPKMQLVDGTHPVVYPALGSHANYYSAALFLGRSGAEGVGCDNTVGPSRQTRPTVVVLPQAATDYLREFPWLGYVGRWGERHPSFDNGPTGPNTKQRWTEPFTWTDTSWRDTAFTVPEGGRFATLATRYFCAAVAFGSGVFNRAGAHAGVVVLIVGALVLFMIWLARRTHWGPAVPLRVSRRRPWGALVTSGFRMYASRPMLFLGIGLLFIPVGLLTALIQYLLFSVGGLHPLVEVSGNTNTIVAELVAGLGVVLTLLALTLVQAAATVAVVDLDAEREVTPLTAYRHALGRVRPLVAGLAIAVIFVTLLTFSVVGILVAAWLLVRWSLLAQAVIIDPDRTRTALQRSARVVKGHWWRTASFTLLVTGSGLLLGPLIGIGLLFVTGASFALVNVVAAVVNMAVMPLVAIATTYLYFDLLVRDRVAERTPAPPKTLPAEA